MIVSFVINFQQVSFHFNTQFDLLKKRGCYMIVLNGRLQKLGASLMTQRHLVRWFSLKSTWSDLAWISWNKDVEV